MHGVQVDPETRKVYVTDRENHRIQIFDENGKYLDQFSTGTPSTPQVLFLDASRSLWIADNDTSKIIKYDIEGHYQYSWGSKGEWPGALWNVHGMSVDSDGNLYLAEVNAGRVEKFRPRRGANPALLVGQALKIRVMKTIAFFACLFAVPSLAGAATCDTLAASLKLTNAKVTAATAVTGGQFTPPASARGGAKGHHGTPCLLPRPAHADAFV